MKYEHLRFYAMIYATKDANDKWKGNLFFVRPVADPTNIWSPHLLPLLNSVKQEKKHEQQSNCIDNRYEMKSNIIPYLFGVKVSRIRLWKRFNGAHAAGFPCAYHTHRVTLNVQFFRCIFNRSEKHSIWKLNRVLNCKSKCANRLGSSIAIFFIASELLKACLFSFSRRKGCDRNLDACNKIRCQKHLAAFAVCCRSHG